MPEPINRFQRAALEVYAGGDFNHIQAYEFSEDHGDSLLTFVLAELSENEDCDSLDTAINRIEMGVEDLKAVLNALHYAAEQDA